MVRTSDSGGPREPPKGCGGRYDAFKERLHQGLDGWMGRRAIGYRQRLLVFHFIDQLKEQILAVLPISFLLIFVIGVFFQQQTNSPGQQAFGLVCAIFGLMFFMDGLRVCVMPLGEMVGNRLPMKYPLPVVLAVAGILGILVTYAEPAISSLTPLAKLVDKTKAPYLYYALNDQREMLVLSIGLGVGMAAVVGTLRFVRGWSLKPIIFIVLAPTIGLACYMQWGNKNLAPLLGLAWDCGAVTTGPVTVPILLAMGIGVMGSQRQKRLAQAALQNAVDTNTGQTLEGFGVVTLASLFPVLAVEIMGIMISVTKTPEDIIMFSKDATSNSPVDLSPTREVIFAIRAIMPLICALLLIVIFLIREPLPTLSVYTVPPHVTGPDDSTHRGDFSNDRDFSGGGMPPLKGKDDIAGTSFPLTVATSATEGDVAASDGSDDNHNAGSTTAKPAAPETSAPRHQLVASSAAPVGEGDETASPAAAADPAALAPQPQPQPQPHPHPPALVVASPAAEAPQSLFAQHQAQAEAAEAQQQQNRPRRRSVDRQVTPHPRKLRDSSGGDTIDDDLEANTVAVMIDGVRVQEPWYVKHGSLIVGIIMSQAGMIMFNIGLTYGFTALGDQAGTLLPAAFLEIKGEPKSPYYSYVGGIVLVMAVAWSLGFLATRAEPALRVLGRTVEHLSNGAFSASMLIYAVSVGVGTGMAVGSTKILFGVPLIYIILVKYAIACTITLFSEEDFTAIAWDSAGVTTGPVTVPFVLSLGIGFSKATGATEGFGILTAASVSPIISVLLTNLLKSPAKAFVRSLSRLSSRRGSLSRSDISTISRRAKRHKNTSNAITSVAAIAAAVARMENGHYKPTKAAKAAAAAASLGGSGSIGRGATHNLSGVLSPAGSGVLSPRDGVPATDASRPRSGSAAAGVRFAGEGGAGGAPGAGAQA